MIGLPLGALLLFPGWDGGGGLWIGLSVGLVVIGVVLVEVWRRKESEQFIDRVRMTESAQEG